MATNITVNFPQLSGKDAMSKTQKIWVPTSDNVDGTLSEYTGDGAGTHHVITGNNLAVIRLENEIPKFAESSKYKKFTHVNKCLVVKFHRGHQSSKD